jgi:hypothetical protein
MTEDHTHGGKYCGAKKKKGKGRCRQSPLKGGNGRCKIHNGNAPKGKDHYNWKTGEYSKYAQFLPDQMKKAYESTKNESGWLIPSSCRCCQIWKRVKAGQPGSS